MLTCDVFRPCDALTITLTLCPNPRLGSDAFDAPLSPASRADKARSATFVFFTHDRSSRETLFSASLFPPTNDAAHWSVLPQSSQVSTTTYETHQRSQRHGTVALLDCLADQARLSHVFLVSADLHVVLPLSSMLAPQTSSRSSPTLVLSLTWQSERDDALGQGQD
jgi:hypothetical protein